MKWFPRWAYLLLCIFLIGAIAGGCQEGNFLTPPIQTIGATLNSTAADREPRYSYNGRYLVFSSDRNAQRGIFLYDVQQRRLVDVPGLNLPNVLQEQPDISADSRYIVYISEQFGKPDVFVYDRQTMTSKRITENIIGEVRHPTISGNGRFVAFESNRSGQWDIEIYDRGPDVEPSLPIESSQPPDPNQPSPTPPQ
ncbi:MAG TPA: biopolymer transporter [Cyanobacteria bacterium UBA11149]|nr:biopolymer transporter [Cyanobacteria bacterium UBA11367]HBE56415.1 biopolymer transporter [Cyanobacteria bacterium UBA11366]HBK66553.1 biopolymer transporter [Cyanobacteria bacterium UBA11166]HBR72956.1 biopolymer transporter [Cyanobacteria bacterium UBA11159]HBS70895.1 biopolymer transporter [Cyanobacteria bacterium UBA11153]HBW89263.1 biopolymer transporter [Cyanobacteria bacterium UBA11149]HCA97453.1 biopolymer transporter [Cyanobacteria bacterium UBA9226]